MARQHPVSERAERRDGYAACDEATPEGRVAALKNLVAARNDHAADPLTRHVLDRQEGRVRKSDKRDDRNEAAEKPQCLVYCGRLSLLIAQIDAEGNCTFAMLGNAAGSFKAQPEASWRLPAAWKAVVKDGQILLWQVFADTKIPFEIIERHRVTK